MVRVSHRGGTQISLAAVSLLCACAEARVPEYQSYVGSDCVDVVLADYGPDTYSVAVRSDLSEVVISQIIRGNPLGIKSVTWHESVALFSSSSHSPVAVTPSLHGANNVVVLSDAGEVRDIVDSVALGTHFTLPTTSVGVRDCTDITGVMVGTTPVYFACCNTLHVFIHDGTDYVQVEEIYTQCKRAAGIGSELYVIATDGVSSPLRFTLSEATLGDFDASTETMPRPTTNAVTLDVQANPVCHCIDIMFKSDQSLYLESYMMAQLPPLSVALDTGGNEAQAFIPDPLLGSRFFVSRTADTVGLLAHNVYAIESDLGLGVYKRGSGYSLSPFGSVSTNASYGIAVKADYLVMCTAKGQMLYLLSRATETGGPTAVPTAVPTAFPTSAPTTIPTSIPTSSPTSNPTAVPTSVPTSTPTSVPIPVPAAAPSAVPGTPSPDTLATDVPPTEVPNVPPSLTSPPPVAVAAPPPALPAEEHIAAAGGVAAVASAVGGGGGAATRLVMATLGCHKEGAAPVELPYALHPTRIQVAGSGSAGAVVGNALVAVGFAVVCAAVLFMFRSCGAGCSGVFASVDAQGLLRLPSAPFFVFQLLYQGTTYGAMKLVLHPPSAVLWGTGFLALVLCVVLPVLVFSTVTKNVPERARYMREQRQRSWAMARLLGPGEWVSLREDCHWVNRYATAVRMYGQEFAWFSLIDFAGSFALSALSAVNATTLVSCGHVKMSAALVFLVMLVVEARLWPHARMRDSAMDFVGLGLQMSAMVLMGLGYYSGARDSTDSWTFATAGLLLTGAVGFVLLKLVLDVIAEVYIFFTKRRANMQQAAFQMFSDVSVRRREHRPVCRVQEACDYLYQESSTGTLLGGPLGGMGPLPEGSLLSCSTSIFL